ncbi:SPOR domain-containing protein [Cochlodiniinecator piscidefendens]|uniref:SPOR domain-containing protein n=1 Tax=Cochlodiniinecator piscidefendens TaxID=2715756 RepID=UPI00140A7563|nr:SPOR domain-containing protein [Cochlodiniinecator piscidefendens]
MTQKKILRLTTVLGCALFLSACEEGSNFNLFQNNGSSSEQATPTSTRLVERDVESPEVFQVNENGLWDGRPSLGGVWVAHPTATDPERVIIRNPSNGNFVIGALFRREVETPGPALQVSSDAAEALGILAGQPTNLSVTALRREEIPEVTENAETQPAIEAVENLDETPLDPVATATAALDAVDAPTPPPQPIAAPVTSSLNKPHIQIGIFSVEDNADATATSMRIAGMTPTVHQHTINGRPFWRVTVGPAASESERASLLTKIQDLGFDDAYFVTN